MKAADDSEMIMLGIGFGYRKLSTKAADLPSFIVVELGIPGFP